MGFLLGIYFSNLSYFIIIIGPISGSLFYGLGGYIAPFLVFGSLSTLIALTLLFCLNDSSR